MEYNFAKRLITAKASNEDAAKILKWLAQTLGRPTKLPEGWTQGGMDGTAEWEDATSFGELTIKCAKFSFRSGYLSLDMELDGPHSAEFTFSCESDSADGLLRRFIGDVKNQLQTSAYKRQDAQDEYEGFAQLLQKLNPVQE
jgi:hypothetical protein